NTGIAELLPAGEREGWASWNVLAPLFGEGDVIVGVLCVGPRASDDGYGPDELAIIEALTGAVGHALGQRLGNTHHAADRVASLVGQECKTCGQLAVMISTTCAACGG